MGAIGFSFDVNSGPFDLTIKKAGLVVQKAFDLTGDFLAENLCAGIYSATIIDQATNCEYNLGNLEIIYCETIVIEGLQEAITPPTTCGGNDGRVYFRFGGGPIGGEPPYTMQLFDEQGNLLPQSTNLLAWDSLESGNYVFVVEDANSCVTNTSFYIAGPFAPIVVSETYQTCPNQANGEIMIVAYVPGQSNEYHYIWSTGDEQITDTIITMTDLAAGDYSVSISLPGEDCQIVEHFGITNYDIEPMSISGTIACSEDNTVSIDLDVEGGISPYNYQWDAPGLIGATPSGLTPGTYCVTVTGFCQSQVTECFSITTVSPSIAVTPGCEGSGVAEITSVSSGFPPYSYSWSNGQTSATATGLDSGPACVTITDNIGCQYYNCANVQNKVYSISVEEPCEGFNDGSVIITIQNPQSDSVSIFLNGIEFFSAPSTDGVTEIPVNNLSGNADYTLAITIGNCSYTESVYIATIPTTEVYSHYVGETCIYDEYCEEDLIVENAIQKDLFYDYVNATGGFLQKCAVKGYCED